MGHWLELIMLLITTPLIWVFAMFIDVCSDTNIPKALRYAAGVLLWAAVNITGFIMSNCLL